MMTHYLACDLGAESGRLMLGSLANGKLVLEEIHRFPNPPIHVRGSMCWNIPRLFEELKLGLRKAAERKLPITSISTDSWGVDYVLLDADGHLMQPTFHYRDARTAIGMARVKSRIDWPALFAETGVQLIPLNTIFQLAAETPQRLSSAGQILMIADAFNFLLSGTA